MEKLGFSGLEDAIINNAVNNGDENIISQYEALNQLSTNQVTNYGEVLKYGLAVSHALNQSGFGDSYFHIGGYATLFHIVNSIGIESIWNWRGSHDLDIVMMKHGGSAVLNQYFDVNSFKSPSLVSKEKLEVKEENTSSMVEVDFYLPQNGEINIDGNRISDQFIKEIDRPSILGVTVNIPKIHDLLSLKLKVMCENTGLPREKDMGDILNLLGCLEHNDGFREKYSSSLEEVEYLKEKLNNKGGCELSQLRKVLQYHQSNPLKYILNSPSIDLRKKIIGGAK
jgi:hypothetical protein